MKYWQSHTPGSECLGGLHLCSPYEPDATAAELDERFHMPLLYICKIMLYWDKCDWRNAVSYQAKSGNLLAENELSIDKQDLTMDLLELTTPSR